MWRVWFDGADWWKGRAGCLLPSLYKAAKNDLLTLKMANAMLVETLDNF
jgi:hypothetical protein